ncbi:S26 family signal peptidase [Phycicoccus flavus]|uniref:S26 family signal peptidase n=1 Tax=Phycicoccus flavus TaxID=2502783 RepID=UPI000FEBA5CE|nr:S26 family signal peptidase [Phycicoccus flavus]NHA66974.1 S26 family signal peptidase [Phycicoccus flavus]
MTAASHPDPGPALAAAPGRGRRVVATLAIGVVVAALVRGLLIESYFVPSAADAPTFEPGDRVLVLKTDHRAEAGDVALVQGADGAARLVPSTAARGDVVGSVVWRFWPLDRFGPVDLVRTGS